MSTVDVFIQSYDFNRNRTLALLDSIVADDNLAALAWRPGDGRAHIAWQFMHIGITEEIFATERLGPNQPVRFGELWTRFRGGSTPDDNIPPLEQIRTILSESRVSLLATLKEYDDSRLSEIPPSLQQRGWTVLTTLSVMCWHESHHHGQAHLTYNLFKNRT
jgi:uncharacterized damage-inducible protein DinB